MKKVCMFVWNHFTNDARVWRECTTLADEGYQVDLICIHDPKDTDMLFFEKVSERFHIHRVKRYPDSLLGLQRLYQRLLRYKTLTTILWLMSIFVLPKLVIPVSILLLLILKTKLKKAIINASITARMIQKGYHSKYDIYHSNDLNTLPQGYICAKWRLKKKPLIYDSHEVQTSRTGYNGKFYPQLEKYLIGRIDSMIVENHTRAQFNQQLYGFYPHVVHNYPLIHNTQTKANVHQQLNLPPEEKILLYQGGIQTGRGLDKLIQAAPHFTEGTVVLIGDGKIKPELQALVKQLNLENKVKFLPKVPLAELPSYTKNAYLGFQLLNNVCFNHYSASSNKLFEYMMAGVPVIACDFPEIKKVVTTAQTGICIDSHKPSEIARAVNQLLADPNQHKIYSTNSLKARLTYNWENEKHHFIRVYQQQMEGA